jgi:hypothetical protein
MPTYALAVVGDELLRAVDVFDLGVFGERGA